MNGTEMVQEWCTKGATRIAGFRHSEGVEWHRFAADDLTDVQLCQNVQNFAFVYTPTCTVCMVGEGRTSRDRDFGRRE
jgi:hypothetical protein